MKCENCGKKLRITSTYCPFCGSKVRKRKEWNLAAGITAFILGSVICMITGIAFWRKFDGILKTNTTQVNVSNLTASEQYCVAETNETIIFTIEADDKTDSVYLCDDTGKQIAHMHDDGKDGDEKAGDLIYTCMIESEEGIGEKTIM